MNKVRIIAWKDIYATFTDRSLLLIMIVTPLLISTIVAVVFGGLADENGITFSDIPMAIVNLDSGIEQQGGEMNYGQQLVDIFLPPINNAASHNNANCPLVEGEVDDKRMSLEVLFATSQLYDVDEARAGVEDGNYAAVVIVPEGFSESLAPQIGSQPDEEASQTVEVYANSGQPIFSSIVNSVVDGYIKQLQTGNIAVAASINTLIAQNPVVSLWVQNDAEVQALLGCGFSPALNTIAINQVSIVTQDDGTALDGFSTILLQIGAAQTVFFGLFSAQFGVLNIIEERRQWTLQRLLISPTSRFEVLAGKLGGTFVTVVFQIVLMMLALMLVATIVNGTFVNLWGANIIGIVVVVLSLALAICGIGTLLAGFAQTPEQAGVIGSVVNIVLALFGGAFGSPLPSPFREISLVYWGVDALDKLSVGNNDIWLNIVVLVVQGVVLFFIGLRMFSRNLDF